jgi:hypothetical protein
MGRVFFAALFSAERTPAQRHYYVLSLECCGPDMIGATVEC